MEGDTPQGEEYNKEYIRVYQSLLKKDSLLKPESSLSLTELSAGEKKPRASVSHSGLLSPNTQAHVRHAVKVIQSNGAPVLTTPSRIQGEGIPQTVSLLGKHRKESSILGYRKKTTGSGRKRAPPSTNDPYYHRWKYLKKYVKQMVFMNAGLCDEVVRQEVKVARAREERSFLLRKLIHYQSMSEIQPIPGGSVLTSSMKSIGEETSLQGKSRPKKKSGHLGDKMGKQTKDMMEGMKVKPKKSKSSTSKHAVPPLPLDGLGRPIFPLQIGDLTVHSIGEIVPDRPGFHTSNSIFPVGYCSTRLYASLKALDKQCLYTCKISDGGNGPMFEIVPDDDPKVFKSRFLSECHSQLLRALNQSRGVKLLETIGKGPEFFGLTHPVVQNLVQSCPGAKKCQGYKWIKFEVNKGLTMDMMPQGSDDPSVSHEALKSRISSMQDQGQSNLRTLLTGALMDTAKLPT
ncbi:transforming growth factor beta regulator 1-like [Mya arenaria]|uniref:transforming growth factor beta regulator 1-like n=1 Tax=Mya arenaria TaxID=6604 RepID=UPI0022E74369|nr:transforming growth factor beta regulator 1-like [Mya arenaria]